MAEVHRGNMEAYQQRSVADRLLPWRREPAPMEMHTGNGETVVYEGKKQTGRKIVGETMVWGGGIFAVWNAVTLDLGGVVGGVATHIAGRWVRPKEGQ